MAWHILARLSTEELERLKDEIAIQRNYIYIPEDEEDDLILIELENMETEINEELLEKDWENGD